MRNKRETEESTDYITITTDSAESHGNTWEQIDSNRISHRDFRVMAGLPGSTVARHSGLRFWLRLGFRFKFRSPTPAQEVTRMFRVTFRS